MLMIIPNICDGCHKEVKELPFRLRWGHEKKYCEKCHHDESSYLEYRFCSDKCFKRFANKFAGHKHEWEVDPIRSGASTHEEKIIEVLSFCKICKIQAWRKDAKLKKQYHEQHKSYFEMSNQIEKNKRKKK